MNKSIRNKKQRKYRSKCKINSKKEQYRMVGSSLLSNNCKQQIFFKVQLFQRVVSWSLIIVNT